jgi:hypothetical protein
MIGQLNPTTMPTNLAFTQGTLASGTRSLHADGRNGVDGSGTMPEGAPAQTEQAPV